MRRWPRHLGTVTFAEGEVDCLNNWPPTSGSALEVFIVVRQAGATLDRLGMNEDHAVGERGDRHAVGDGGGVMRAGSVSGMLIGAVGSLWPSLPSDDVMSGQRTGQKI